jgi:toxin YoeB
VKTIFSPEALKDLFFWAESDPKTLARIFRLIADMHRHPMSGLGKPEPLKHSASGSWSRRITGEHRLVYRIRGSGGDQVLEIIACRGHYDD